MSEGDLLTTPNWTWHDHFNGGDEPIIWLDGLDIRLVGTFGAMIQENFKKEQQPIEKPDHYSAKVFGQARPTWIKSEFAAPPYRYPWLRPTTSLLALKESAGDPFDGVLWIFKSAYRRADVADVLLPDSASSSPKKEPNLIVTRARRCTMLSAAAG
jgi:gentisate 1,2-dioxygenase